MTRYNLIILHYPKAQQISDFQTIRDMMADAAPDIDVHIVTTGTANPKEFWHRAARHPTLIFSAAPAVLRPAVRGTRLISTGLSKLEEAWLVHKAGFPVPQTTKVTPETVLDEKQWGPFTVLKPLTGSMGRRVRLVRTKHVRWVHPLSWPEDDFQHGRDMIAQQYVHSGDHVNCYRVFMVLGEVIYSIFTRLKAPLSLPDPRGSDEVDIPIAANTGEREVTLNHDDEVLSFAHSLYSKFPMLPVMPVDIVRHRDSGQLFVMEINSHGLSWHLSSPFGQKQQQTHGLDYYAQFNGLEKIAKALIERTRQSAA